MHTPGGLPCLQVCQGLALHVPLLLKIMLWLPTAPRKTKLCTLTLMPAPPDLDQTYPCPSSPLSPSPPRDTTAQSAAGPHYTPRLSSLSPLHPPVP